MVGVILPPSPLSFPLSPFDARIGITCLLLLFIWRTVSYTNGSLGLGRRTRNIWRRKGSGFCY